MRSRPNSRPVPVHRHGPTTREIGVLTAVGVSGRWQVPQPGARIRAGHKVRTVEARTDMSGAVRDLGVPRCIRTVVASVQGEGHRVSVSARTGVRDLAELAADPHLLNCRKRRFDRARSVEVQAQV